MKLGTRGSALALWQARTVAALLLERTGIACEIVTIRTAGDERSAAAQDGAASQHGAPDGRPNPSYGGPGLQSWPDVTKGVFVKEIEDALLAGRVDLAVHSAKDMSAVQPDGLTIGAALPREDPRDAVVLPATVSAPRDLDELLRILGDSPRIGTSSVRRTAQLARVLPRATFIPVRGNVDTRLRKLDEGACDVLVLASAGLRRLDFGTRISLALPVELCTPAPGQGIVAVQARADDAVTRGHLAAITDADAADALAAEQAVVAALGGGCHLPLGALARIDAATLTIDGTVVAPDGSRAIRDRRAGPRGTATDIGHALAQALLIAGANEILRA